MSLKPAIRRTVAAVGHAGRELMVWSRLIELRALRRRPTVVFLQGDEMAGRLRAGEVAEAMRADGWAAIVVPPQLSLSQRRRLLRAAAPAVTVLQQCRHPLNDPALIDVPTLTVLDIDDADWIDPANLERLERVTASVDLVVAGSRNVAQWCRTHQDDVEVVWTTAELPALPTRHEVNRPPVIAWASSGANELAAERRFVLRVLTTVAAAEPFELWVYGVRDEAEVLADLAPLTSAGIRITCHPTMAYPSFLRSLSAADIGLNPLCHDENPYSLGKSFGKVLAYIGAGLAVVTTPTVDHPLFFEDGRNGVMASGEEAWAEALTGLLRDPQRIRAMADAARADYVGRLDPATASRLLREIFERRLAAEPETAESSRGSR